MASGCYNRFKANLMNKIVDMEADTIKVLLLDSGYTFAATHNVIGDVSGDEIADTSSNGDGYATGGKTLASGAVTQAATTKFDGTDTAWTVATITARYAVLYDDTVGTDDLIACFDFGSNKSSVAGTFTIQWAGAGIITLA